MYIPHQGHRNPRFTAAIPCQDSAPATESSFWRRRGTIHFTSPSCQSQECCRVRTDSCHLCQLSSLSNEDFGSMQLSPSIYFTFYYILTHAVPTLSCSLCFICLFSFVGWACLHFPFLALIFYTGYSCTVQQTKIYVVLLLGVCFRMTFLLLVHYFFGRVQKASFALFKSWDCVKSLGLC